MNNNEIKTIKDEKMIYLIKTLSRTRRKDYENYVVNAIWNKLNNNEIEIVSQQYIYNVKDPRKHYFIDLYFPALNIGIECDEAHHQNEGNKERDTEREVSIFDALHQIDSKGYTARHIDVTKSFQEIQNQIEEAVRFINQKTAEVKPSKWSILSASEYFCNKHEITIKDRIGFKTISQACNVLFSTNYSEASGGSRKSYFTPKTFKNTEYVDYKVWFPKLAVYDENGSPIAATPQGWKNQLKNDGKELIEDNDDKELDDSHDHKKRIAFAKYKDPLGDNAYKFVGVFRLHKIVNGKRYYDRINESCTLLRQ
jgi:very-short-patch-repair endonuclease